MSDAPFEIPEQLRDTAEKSVEQAKEAFDQFFEATQKAVETTEDAARNVSDSAAGINRQTMSFMEDSISASFDLAQRIVQARTAEEIAALQQEYFRHQAAAMARQGQDLGRMFGEMASDAAKSVKD